ncbi:hypothetical protein MAKP6SUB1_36900 [Klebsiella pneumoniae]|nr:hypothetical protein MAKP3_36790 [Klebsiella pneumoniae]GKM82387.1 hypothetical protein NUKP68_38980 [Klebsiella variicola]BCU23613.1 hypothetical protein MAKP4_36860 [Klebsiella pneumoniae]BCU28767.1 hypothetical protein MAKP5_36810 [Klebsiella pneumoniae]BCU34087.1 hypothetical protein MAKP6SUB1_36900 [Klebsiella pneumoniae]
MEVQSTPSFFVQFCTFSRSLSLDGLEIEEPKTTKAASKTNAITQIAYFLFNPEHLSDSSEFALYIF